MSKTFEGRPVTAKISDERINAPPSPPFLYMHHPNAWDCLDTVYADKFTTPRKIGHGTFSKVIWDHDLEAFNTFRRGLISSGVVSNPDPSILEFQIALLDKRIARRVKSAHVPHIQKEVDAALSEKEALIEAKTTKKTTVKKKRAPKKAPAVK